MGSQHRHSFLLLSLLQGMLLLLLLLPHQVKSLDENQNLLQGLNQYRASLNLSVLTENSDADCLAGVIANQLKIQPCSNTTGADTIPGTETQFSNYPELLSQCHLNITDTRDGQVMPACVPNLVPDLVLTNFTQTQYSQYLNSSTYTGAGVGSSGNWIVVTLSTNTVGGSFTPVQNAASLLTSVGLAQTLLPLLWGFAFVLPN